VLPSPAHVCTLSLHDALPILMSLSDRWVGILTTFAAIGIGVGSMAAGRLSGNKVELGLAPIGSIGMGVFAVLLSRSGHSFALARSEEHTSELQSRVDLVCRLL